MLRTGRVLVLLAALCAATLTGAPAAAQNQAVPSSQAQIELTFAPLVRAAAPAVVNIYTRKVVKQRVSPLFDDPFFRRFFGDSFPGRERRRIQNSLGSGVIVDPDGLIVTNHHVIKDADEIIVVLSDRNEFEAKLVQTDDRTDLAVLRIDVGARKLPFLELRDADELEVGDLVLAIGNPFGVGKTVTSGIVSALARTSVGISDFRFFIQTDAAINPGNSGGALISMDGRLVGINTAIYSRSGGSIGIGFAIPSNMVSFVIAAAKGGKLIRPWLGAAGQDVTSDLAGSLGLERPQGILVNEIYDGGPADKAGLEIGDIVTEINGHEVTDGQEVRFRIASMPVGGVAKLTILRKGVEKMLSVSLQAPPEEPPRDLTLLQGRNPLAGATAANLSPALAEEIGADTSARGVVVTSIQRGSNAHRFRIKPGDVVEKVNETDIASVAQLRDILATGSRSWNLIMRRAGKTFRVAVRG